MCFPRTQNSPSRTTRRSRFRKTKNEKQSSPIFFALARRYKTSVASFASRRRAGFFFFYRPSRRFYAFSAAVSASGVARPLGSAMRSTSMASASSGGVSVAPSALTAGGRASRARRRRRAPPPAPPARARLRRRRRLRRLLRCLHLARRALAPRGRGVRREHLLAVVRRHRLHHGLHRQVADGLPEQRRGGRAPPPPPPRRAPPPPSARSPGTAARWTPPACP